jgi:signal transduction histidine kinase
MIGSGLEKRFTSTVDFNPVWIILILGFLLTAYTFHETETNNSERLQKNFDTDASHVAKMIETRLNDHLIDLDALQSFYMGSEVVTREEFTAFVTPALSARSGILAFVWTPRVTAADRAAFEAAIGRSIGELDEYSRLVPAGRRPYYYPSLFSEPAPANGQIFGYDLGSDFIRRTAMETAGDSGAAIATAPLQLFRETSVQYGLVVFKPVYERGMATNTVGERRAALRGYVSAVFRSGDLIRSAVGPDHLAGLNITISDTSGGAPEQVIVESALSGQPVVRSGLPILTPYRTDFLFAGHPWRIEIAASIGYTESRANLSHWGILPIGALLTVIIAFIVDSLYSETSRRRRTEAALEASRAELVAKNSELASALDNLRQAQVRLIQQEKLAGIGQLAAGVAHEINNPLGYVTANIETLTQNFADLAGLLKQYRHLRDTINAGKAAAGTSGQIAAREKELDIDFIITDFPDLVADTDEGLKRINKIVQGMRSFSRTAPHMEFENLDLNKCIENTLLIAHSETKYHADVATALADLPAIEAVGGEIHQVLLNLLVNALHAIIEKGPGVLGTIKITTRQEGEVVCCDIEDSGTGIPADICGSIFDPFFTTKPLGQGTGLGLSICYDIVVNRHHGSIDVASSPGKGAKFTVKLPIKQPPPGGRQ